MADAVAASPTEVAELRELMASENVQQHIIWHTLFSAAPPQGVLVRIGRLLGASLHARHAELYNFLDKDDFVDEVRRMEAWYTKGHGDNLAAGMEYGEETSNQKK